MIQLGVTFSTLGVPETGLSPIITIRDTSDGSIVVNGLGMTEVGGGAYKYNFTNDTTKKYCVVMDGGVDTLDSRYMTAWSERAKTEAEIVRILTATEIKQCTITDASPGSLSFTTDLTETSNQFWTRGVVLITSGSNTGQMRAILNYNGSTKAVTLKTPLDVAPAQNDTFIILTERKYLTPDTEDIVDAIWDETASDHVASGSIGAALNFLKNMEGGKWHIIGNQMIFYEDDNTTEICRFNLFDKEDHAASDNVYRRERV